MNKIYFYFFYFFATLFILVLGFVTLYFVSPDWTSKKIISKFLSQNSKVLIRKNFIEKNLKKHINTVDQNQFINLGIKKYKLGFDYNPDKNLNHNVYQDVSHIDIWNDNLLLTSSEGNFFHFKNTNLANFIFKKSPIKSNLKNLNFLSDKGFSVKDILINDNFIYVSYVEIKTKDCLSLVIEKAKINLKYLKFEKFFNPEECVNRSETLGNIHHPGQAGGRMAVFGESKILFTTGNFRSLKVSQNDDSIYGKI